MVTFFLGTKTWHLCRLKLNNFWITSLFKSYVTSKWKKEDKNIKCAPANKLSSDDLFIFVLNKQSSIFETLFLGAICVKFQRFYWIEIFIYLYKIILICSILPRNETFYFDNWVFWFLSDLMECNVHYETSFSISLVFQNR